MTKIKQFLLNESDYDEYVCILKFKLKNEFCYMLTNCIGDPILKLQEVLLLLHSELGYSPLAKVLVANKSTSGVAVSYAIMEDELLYNSRYHFSNRFSKFAQLYKLDQSKLLTKYHEYVPDVSGLRLESKLPAWHYSDEELADIDKVCVEQDENYMLVSS